jgi:hypothetical protein|nr:MAG TPA: YtxH-like protein [Caudoviricetes sp.]
MLFAIGLIVGLIVGVVVTYVYLNRKFLKTIEGVIREFNERISDAFDE